MKIYEIPIKLNAGYMLVNGFTNPGIFAISKADVITKLIAVFKKKRVLF